MLSILDIILISLGGTCIVVYAVLKILQLRKFRKMVKIGIEHGLTELEARKNAYESIYQKQPKQNDKHLDVNTNDETFE